MVSERHCGLLPATIRFTVDGAQLPALRRVDAEKPNALAADLDGIAVDDARLANGVGVGSASPGKQHNGKSQRDDWVYSSRVVRQDALRR